MVSDLEAGRKYAQDLIDFRYEIEEWEKAIAKQQEKLNKDFKKAKKTREKDEKKAEENGKEYKEKKYKEDKKPEPPKFDAARETLGRIANGEIPLFVQVHRVAEIRELLKSTERFGRLRLIIAGGTEAMSCAEELASRQVSVVVWPTLLGETGKAGYDEFDAHDLTLLAASPPLVCRCCSAREVKTLAPPVTCRCSQRSRSDTDSNETEPSLR